MNTLEIISAQICPFAQRSLILLEEKGIDYKLTEIDLKNKPDWFTQVSPYGKVPLIRHDGRYIYESAVINEYLNEVYPVPNLLGDTAYQRSLVRNWVAFANNQLTGAFYKLLFEKDVANHPEQRKKLTEVMEFLEKESFGKQETKGDYLLGNILTLADITLYPFFERLIALQHYRDFELPEACIHLKQWITSMAARTAVKATANSEAFYIKHYAKYMG